MAKIPEFVLRGWVASTLIIVAVGLAGALTVNLWSTSDRIAEATAGQRALETRAAELEQQLAAQSAELESLQDDAAARLETLQTDIDAARDAAEAAAAERDEAVARLDVLSEERDAALAAEADLRARIAELTAEHDTFGSVEAELRDRVAELTTERDAARDELARAQSALAEIRNALDAAGAAPDHANGATEPTDADNGETATEIDNGLVDELEAALTERASLQERLLGAQAAFKDAFDARLAAEARADALAETVASLTDAQERLADSLADMTAERDAALEQLAQLEADVVSLAVDHETLQQQLLTSEAELDRNRQALRQRSVELAAQQQRLFGAAQREASLEQRYLDARSLLAMQQANEEDHAGVIEALETQLAVESAAMERLRQQLSDDQVVNQKEREDLVSITAAGATVIKLPEHVLFESGSARIDDNGRQTLARLAEALASFPGHTISIEGHSDSLPILAAYQHVYPTNWELSAARASAAVQVLADFGIDTRRMQAVGRADTHPVAEEIDEASRQLNRRIEVLLYPDSLQTTVATISEVHTLENVE